MDLHFEQCDFCDSMCLIVTRLDFSRHRLLFFKNFEFFLNSKKLTHMDTKQKKGHKINSCSSHTQQPHTAPSLWRMMMRKEFSMIRLILVQSQKKTTHTHILLCETHKQNRQKEANSMTRTISATCPRSCDFREFLLNKMSSNTSEAIEAKDLLDVCLKWQKYKHKEGKGVVSKSSSKDDVKKHGYTKRSSASREDVARAESVIHVQKKRLEEYEVFENALVALLRSELKSVDVQKYQSMTSVVTKRFSALSNQVRKIVSSLSSRKENENETSDTYLRDTVRNIQNMEREKLHMVHEISFASSSREARVLETRG